MAVYSNIVIDQGSTYSASIDVADSDGDNINLTGYTAAGQIRKTYSSSTAVDFATSIANPSSGVVTISLTSAQTNAMKAGRYVYDVEITQTSTGTITRVLEGQVEITPGVTQ